MKQDALLDVLDLAGRLLLAALFVEDLFNILANYGATAAYMNDHGVPGFLLPLVILLQAGGVITIVLGWYARLGALALAGYCICTAVIFHNQLSDQNEAIQFMKDLALAGGFLVLAANGPRRFTLKATSGREA